MQVAKVCIASVLILTACARLPEGKECLLKCVSDVKFPQMSSAILKCSMINYVLCAHYVQCKFCTLTSCDV